jgi:hypothetical protein
MMSRGITAIALTISAGALMLASCAGVATPHPSASASAFSGIYGIALLSPGYLMVGSPSPLPDGFHADPAFVAAPRAVVLIKAADGEHAGQVVARVRSDRRGLFRVALPPGSYLLVGKYFLPGHVRVTVHAGGYTRVSVVVAVHY